MDRGAIRAGLFGFNGVLVGAGLSLFLQPDWDVLVMVWIVVGAFFSTILHAALAAVFIGAWKVPPFTLAFNFITLIFLIGALNFANGRVGGLVAPADAQVTGGEVGTTLRSAADAASANNIEGVLNAILRGISQLFFANSIVAGIIIIVGHRRVLADRGDLRASSARRWACSPGWRSARTASRSTTACGGSTPSTPRWPSAACSSCSRGGRACSRSPAPCSRRCCSGRSPRCSRRGGCPP